MKIELLCKPNPVIQSNKNLSISEPNSELPIEPKTISNLKPKLDPFTIADS